MTAGAHVIQLGERRNLPEMRDAARMDDGRADVVDQLLGDQRLAVEHRVEDFAHRDGRDRVLANQPERLLVFGGGRILHPEQTIRFERPAEAAGLDRGQPVMDIVQQMMLVAQAHGALEERRVPRPVTLCECLGLWDPA